MKSCFVCQRCKCHVRCFIIFAGAATCYNCNSRDDKSCTPESLNRSKKIQCRSGDTVCAVSKIEPYSPDGNTSNHQYVRFCDRECLRYNTTFTLPDKTKRCTLCCKSDDLCNNYTMDPCNPSKAGRLGHETFTIALLGVLAVLLRQFV